MFTRIVTGLLVLLLAPCVMAGETTVTLRENAQTTGDYIRLSEIAEISGEAASRLSTLFVGPAPQKQQEKTLAREEVQRCLRMRGLDEGVTLTGSETVRVQGVEAPQAPAPVAASAMAENVPAQEAVVPQETFQAAIKAAAEQASAANAADNARKPAAGANSGQSDALQAQIAKAVNEYLIKALGIRNPAMVDIAVDVSRHNLTTPAASIEIDALRSGSLPGRASASLILRDKNGQVAGNATADLSVALTVTVTVLMRNLRQNENVKPGDVALRKMRYKDGMPVNPIDPADLDGMAALQNLRAGSFPLPGDFGPGLDIRKGQSITVAVNGNGFNISELATAGADGRRGETIPVESVVAKVSYRARITGPGRAEVPMHVPAPAVTASRQ